MDVSEFKAGLAKHGLGPGAKWHKADFHVHLPGSSDYEYKGEDAFERLGHSISEAGLGFAVVLKHQEVPSREDLQRLQRACPDTKLIPGAEINVLVDTLFKKVAKDHFFHCILAVDPEQPGEYGYALRKAQEQFTYRPGDYPAGFRSSILDLGRFLREEGAIFIPAHLHQSKKPETSRSIDDLYDDDAFLGFVRDGAFTALEVRDVSTARFFDGLQETNEGLAIPRSVCVASSDAHHHSHISERSRWTWVRTEDRTFPELVAALSFPHRVALSPQAARHPRVLGLHVVGSFIPECWIALNEGLNALVGSKGSGKTALLECLRFVLCTPVPQERSESVGKHIAHILGSAGYVECLISRGDGSEAVVTRRADSPDRISVVDASGSSLTLKAGDGPGFPVSILGWHEIEAVADKAAARITLLDRAGDPQSVRQLRTAIAAEIERARDTMPLLQREVKRLDAELRELWGLQLKRETLTRLQQADLVALQEQYEWFLLTEQKLIGLREAVAGQRQVLPGRLLSKLPAELSPPPDASSVADAVETLEGIGVLVKEEKDVETDSAERIDNALDLVSKGVVGATERLAASFNHFRETTYTPKVNALPPADREILAKQIQVLEETKRLPIVEQQASALLHAVKELAELLHGACDTVCMLRDQIAAQRQGLVTQLNKELPNIRLDFKRSANREARDRFQSRHGSDAGGLLDFLQEQGSGENYVNLRSLFAKLRNLDLTRDRWKIKETLWDVKVVDLFDVLDDDDVELSLNVGKAGFVPIQSLSAGQRCVAVFPLLLRDTRGPLVIDQPEDNLDNRYIASVIAPDLVDRKVSQQFLVTSHNANLVVLTDADLICHVDSDGSTISFPAAGFLACPKSKVRKSVLDVLDGGEAALGARRQKYGL